MSPSKGPRQSVGMLFLAGNLQQNKLETYKAERVKSASKIISEFITASPIASMNKYTSSKMKDAA